MSRARRPGLDTIRGLTLLSMMAYHACWDLVYLFHCDWAWYRSFGAYLWQQSICWTFILLSGYCVSLGRHPLRRGLITLAAGAVVSLGARVGGTTIQWGVLTLLGAAAVLTVPLRPLLEKTPPRLGLAASFSLFLLTRDVNRGFLGFEGGEVLALPASWYRDGWTALLGFPGPDFTSSDYFSLIPWLFLFWTGFFLYRLRPEGERRELRLPVVTALGRRSLLVYLLHQPVIYGILLAGQFLIPDSLNSLKGGVTMKKLVLGILAHVDAGKTTLSEALLYRSGALRRLGRVDHRDAFLDTDAMERERGITIFSKQAEFSLPGLEVTLLDTPGHVDFSAEAERTLRVLDAAVLVISGADGVQAHTRTLWKLLGRYGVPVFLFVNKMDLAGVDRERLLADLKRLLDGGCVDFSAPDWAEEAAVCGEDALERYLETGDLPDGTVMDLIRRRQLFPCCFGSALKLEGVDAFLDLLGRFAPAPDYPAAFGARVFKIARDPQGARLTYLKVTGGALRVKDVLTNRRADTPEEAVWTEKADQLRIYSGAKFRTVEEAPAGTVCAVTGLTRTRPGDGLGFETDWAGPVLEPVLTYRVELPDGADPHTALRNLRQLEEEDPQLHVLWSESAREIHVQLMGEVQLEILQRLIRERFGLEVSFGAGAICYRETIAAPVIGIGHFEPLRHYAEVHLLLEPLPRGSGLHFASACSTDVLDLNWQRLVLTHLGEKEHLGVLTGSPITDLRITLLAGRAHDKHTEGGDFRQATYRAVRQGLMQAESVLLEPWYEFRLEVPADQVGRAMGDLQRMGGETAPPETEGDLAVLAGAAPVAGLRDYAREVAAYTRGRGRLSCQPGGFRPCADQAAVVVGIGYDPERDVENTPDSVFCDHGAGMVVPWYEVPDCAQVETGFSLEAPEEPAEAEPPQARRSAAYAGTIEQDKELQAIFERTYGPVKRKTFLPPKEPRRPASSEERSARTIREQFSGPEYLLVDGYNIIFAWDELKAIARENLDAARKALCDLLCNYRGYRNCEVIAVFDAYKVKGGQGSVEQYHNIHVVYTKEAETADAYIERATYEIGKHHRVKVATSDGPEQLIILGHGALRLSASAFHEEMEAVEGQIAGILSANNRSGKTGAVRSALERAQRQKDDAGEEEANP